MCGLGVPVHAWLAARWVWPWKAKKEPWKTKPSDKTFRRKTYLPKACNFHVQMPGSLNCRMKHARRMFTRCGLGAALLAARWVWPWEAKKEVPHLRWSQAPPLPWPRPGSADSLSFLKILWHLLRIPENSLKSLRIPWNSLKPLKIH